VNQPASLSGGADFFKGADTMSEHLFAHLAAAWVYDDGGRTAAGFKGEVDDCAVRAIAIATGTSYREVYGDLFDHIQEFARGRSRAAKRLAGSLYARTPRHGVPKEVSRQYLRQRGWAWVPTMKIGQGCKVHLRADELPAGRLIVSVSRHLVAVIDGVIHDTHDCSREGTRCVYGYFSRAGI
jgi:hypothetical protein